MQRRSARNRRSTDIVLLSGWLFADLLLALAVIFLVSSNTIATRPTPTPTPMPTATPTPTPTATALPPTPIPRLELNKRRITLTVDAAALMANSQDAVNNLKQQVQAQGFLQNRTVGLVIVYTGAPNDDAIGNAQIVDMKVIDALKSFGPDYPIFARASYYDTDSTTELYTLGPGSNNIIIDVYLFA